MKQPNIHFKFIALWQNAFQYSQLKKFWLLLFFSFLVLHSFANHLKGGWIQYEYLGVGVAANTSQYRITVKQYLDCGSTGNQRDQIIYLGAFDAVSGAEIRSYAIPLSGSENPNKTSFNACLSNPPIGKVCYFIDSYVQIAELPNNTNGYTLAVQRCCRIAGIVNVDGNSNSIGVTYSNKIPGVINTVDYHVNSSPVFAQKDTAIVCHNSSFTFDFSATDKDGDDLLYVFCDGLIGGGSGNPQPNPPSAPPYTTVSYSSGYSGTQPLGPTVVIDRNTGIISGTAPSSIGDYVIAVCALEYRAGVLIGSTKKEIHITVADCSLSAASLKPTYISCNGYTLNFQNESTSSNIAEYLWTFGDTKIPASNSSILPTPTHNYSDTGVYPLKLVVTSSGGCKDSASSLVKIFPGFTPDFTVTGNCFLNPYKFFDKTSTKWGVVANWKWNFGDLTTLADSATHKDSAWKYATAQTITAKLIVANDKGCVDSVTKTVSILDKPSLSLAFKDTLICSIDTLQLKANINSGLINWVPNNAANKLRIINNNTSTPLVYPKDSTSYIVTINDNGCINTDTVQVNVLQFISVKAGLDSNVCKTDSFRLTPASQALSFQWTSSTGEVVASVKNPMVQPLVDTRYYVTANLGKCQAKDSIFYAVSPYPLALLGADTIICYGSRVMLQGFVLGDTFNWSPTNSLINPNSIAPIAGPTKTTQYILTASYSSGCLKTVSDTIKVTIVPQLSVYAGRDTSIVASQPLQLNATGATTYLWSPSIGLSDPKIANPVAVLTSETDSVTYKVTGYDAGGCNASDLVTVRVYKSQPEIFVPTAFTPDGDGKNDILKPITVGIVKLNYFSIYNRWGNQIFYTTELGKGWDGKWKGTAQSSGTYVYSTEGTDYLGNRVYRKGTIVLIR